VTSLLLLAGFVPSCSASKDTTAKTVTLTVPQSPSLPPNACRIVGTIMTVLAPAASTEPGPCGKVPCQADVRVDSILGYGSSFPYPLAAGAIVRMRFSYTLAPTTAMFPGTADLPKAMTAGDAFSGVMEGGEGLAPKAGSVTIYTISMYQKK
jgi:hypothetical protein